MKHLAVLICGGVLLGGCYSHCSSFKEERVAPVATEEMVSVDRPVEVAAHPPTTQPAAITSVQKVPVTAPVIQTAHAPVTQPAVSTVSEPVNKQPVAITVPSAPKPSTPAPDRAVFKDEPLIDLNGRLLNPLANQIPFSDKDTPSPWQGEQLKYGVYYSFVKAGTAYIKNRGLIEADGKKAYVIQTSAFSAPVIDSVFKVRDINLSWLDAKNFHSLGYSQSLREGKYKRDEWALFDYPQKEYRGQVKKKSSPRSYSGELSQPVLDMLTSLYYVRAQNLQSGKEVVFDIINREEKYPLIVKVLGKETVKTEAGKFKCIVVEPQFRGEGIFVSKGKSLKVWLTDDAYKMPIKMKAEVFIGSVSAELLEYKRN